MTEIRESFLDYWCDEIPDYLRVKWRENVDGLLDTPNANEKLQAAWEAWQAARATPADQEPVAYEYQHDEGRITFVAPWQKEHGWEQANDRWTLVGPVYRHASNDAPDARRYRWLKFEKRIGRDYWTDANIDKHIAAASPQAPQPDAQSVRDAALDEAAAVLDRRINGWRERKKTILNGQIVADELEHHAHLIRDLKSAPPQKPPTSTESF